MALPEKIVASLPKSYRLTAYLNRDPINSLAKILLAIAVSESYSRLPRISGRPSPLLTTRSSHVPESEWQSEERSRATPGLSRLTQIGGVKGLRARAPPSHPPPPERHGRCRDDGREGAIAGAAPGRGVRRPRDTPTSGFATGGVRKGPRDRDRRALSVRHAPELDRRDRSTVAAADAAVSPAVPSGPRRCPPAPRNEYKREIATSRELVKRRFL